LTNNSDNDVDWSGSTSVELNSFTTTDNIHFVVKKSGYYYVHAQASVNNAAVLRTKQVDMWISKNDDTVTRHGINRAEAGKSLDVTLS
jgi:hypothetical protein